MGEGRRRKIEREALEEKPILFQFWRAVVDFVRRHPDWFKDHE
jgi:hypothetical protein